MQLNSRRRRNHGAGAHSPHDVIPVTLDDPNHNTRPTNRIADTRRYQASSIATRILMNTDSARTRHSASYRLVRDPQVLLADVQWILGHAHLSTTELYLNTTPQDAIDDVLAHYRRRAEAEQAPPAALSDGEPGYRAEILDALFGDVR